MLKSIKFFCIVVILVAGTSPGYAQDEVIHRNGYRIMLYNEDFVKLKHKVFRSIKLTKDAKKLNASGLVSAILHLDDTYKIQSVHSNSNVGYGIDDALVHAIEKVNGGKGRDFSKMSALIEDQKLAFDVPFYVFDQRQTTMVMAPMMMGAGGAMGFGFGVPLSSNKDFIMVVDFYYQNPADSVCDYTNIFPQGSFEKYVEHFAAAYIEKKINGMFAGGFSPGQYTVTFKVDPSGHLKDIKTVNVHQKTNTISRFLKKNEEVFSLNPITAQGQPKEVECVMVFGFYNKTGLF